MSVVNILSFLTLAPVDECLPQVFGDLPPSDVQKSRKKFKQIFGEFSYFLRSSQVLWLNWLKKNPTVHLLLPQFQYFCFFFPLSSFYLFIRRLSIFLYSPSNLFPFHNSFPVRNVHLTLFVCTLVFHFFFLFGTFLPVPSLSQRFFVRLISFS